MSSAPSCRRPGPSIGSKTTPSIRSRRTAPAPDRAFVLLDNTTIRLGSDRVPKPLPYERAKLPRGTIVKIIGDKEFAEGKEWWPIQPPPSEVRYVAKSSLSPTDFDRRLRVSGRSDRCHIGIIELADESAVASGSTGRSRPRLRTGRASVQATGRRDGPARRRPRSGHPLLQPNRATEPGTNRNLAGPAAGARNVGQRPIGAAAPPPTTVSASPPSISSGPGWLRRTGLLIDGQTAYVVEDNRGQRKYYVLGQQGLYPGLESYVNRPVEVYGPMVQRTDLAGGGYISVNRIQYLR